MVALLHLAGVRVLLDMLGQVLPDMPVQVLLATQVQVLLDKRPRPLPSTPHQPSQTLSPSTQFLRVLLLSVVALRQLADSVVLVRPQL